MKIESKAAEALSFENYAAQPEIHGVQVARLRKHRSLEGSFMECLRITGGFVEGIEPPFEVRQLSLSLADPGRINAFHLHPKRVQDEIWCVIAGRLAVWLIDVREGSPTQGNRRQYLLSGEEPMTLMIPSGVAHGYRAGSEGATLVYAMNDQFDPEDPNEGRLPWDLFGADLWDENRG